MVLNKNHIDGTESHLWKVQKTKTNVAPLQRVFKNRDGVGAKQEVVLVPCDSCHNSVLTDALCLNALLADERTTHPSHPFG